MEPLILNGKALAEVRKISIRTDVLNFMEQYQHKVCLAVILVGEDPASTVYVNHKQRACKNVDIDSKFIKLEETVSEQFLIELIKSLNQDTSVDGILVQLPLPAHINKERIIESIAVEKDVDGFHPYNVGLLAQGRQGLRPCTPRGVMRLLEHYDINVKSKHAVIIGASNIVGRPMCWELLNAGATPTICHRRTKNLQSHVSQADIIISATGNRSAVDSNWLQEGQVVIDVGIHRLPTGKLCGDIDFNIAVSRKVKAITPVPGGVGPMTVTCLLENTLQSAIATHSKTRM